MELNIAILGSFCAHRNIPLFGLNKTYLFHVKLFLPDLVLLVVITVEANFFEERVSFEEVSVHLLVDKYFFVIAIISLWSKYSNEVKLYRFCLKLKRDLRKLETKSFFISHQEFKDSTLDHIEKSHEV